MTLGERIKQLRNQAELTQPELAVNAGIEQSYLSKLENDKASPSFDIVNKVAVALGTSALAIINSLPQDYVKENLSYIPEVSAQFAESQLKQQQAKSRRVIWGVMMFVLGIGMVIAAGSKAVFPEVAYNYTSNGVIKPGESLEVFDQGTLTGESREAWAERLSTLTSRLDEVYKVSNDYLGERYVVEVDGGKRVYWLMETTKLSERKENAWLVVIGMMLLTGGAFVFGFALKKD